jgi:hypothetical protein
MSSGPNVDVRHNKTFTSIKLDPEDFKKLPEGYREISYKEMKDWDLRGMFGKDIKRHAANDFDYFEKQ